MKNYLLAGSGAVMLGIVFWLVLADAGLRNQIRAQQAALAILQKQNDDLAVQRNAIESANEQLQALTDARTAISGIYECNEVPNGPAQMDIRTDGTGLYYNGYSNGRFWPAKPINWTCDGSILSAGPLKFKLENGDLIDEKNRRWFHVR